MPRGRTKSHGDAIRGSIAPEYNSWRAMKKRCYSEGDISYPRYGGNGITVCDRWLNSYENFLEDMGRKPSPLHSLEREKNDVGYTPDNCIWADDKAQQRNKTNNNVVEVGGKKMLFIEACENAGLNRCTVASRMRTGLTLEQALAIPLQDKYSHGSHRS